MITVTLQEAKATLHQLVEQAHAGEQVVLMRGSEIVALLQPVSARDLDIAPRLSDTQAGNFWKSIADDAPAAFPTVNAAVTALKRKRKRAWKSS